MTDGKKRDSDDLVERLVRLADEGPDIPAGGADRVRAQVRPLWEREVRGLKIRRISYWSAGAVALAAMIAVVLLAPPLRRQPPPLSIAPVAFIDVVSGTLEVDPPGEGAGRFESGATERAIEPGSALRTGAEDRASVRLAAGAVVRIDARTILRLSSPREIELDRGAVYIDSAAGGPVEVRTPFGTARDIGTQFEVRADSATLVVRVRQGTVAVQPRSGAAMAVEEGTALSISANGVRTTAPISAGSADWNWTLAVSSLPDIEGMPVASLLEWISAETGLEVRYEDADTERFARATLLHGSLGRLRPDQIPEAVLPGAGLEVTRDPDGSLLVRRAR